MRLTFCAACGTWKDGLEHHQLIPRSKGDPDTPENLVTLCRSCHGKLHGVGWDNDLGQLIKAGLQRAVANGETLGRRFIESDPAGAAKAQQARELLAKGQGINLVAKTVGLSNGTVARIKAEM
jgi:hypothetical protein